MANIEKEDNVFGDPITNSKSEGTSGYEDKNSTRLERARQAWKTKDDDNKKKNALHYLEKLKEEFGDGISTKVILYNATGDDLTFLTSHDYLGHKYSDYPQTIANGQWGAFLHVKTDVVATGSCGAVAYLGQNNDNYPCAWLVSWSNPWNKLLYNNKCYTEIRDADHYTDGIWGIIWDLTEAYDTHDTWNGCYSTVKIPSTGTTVVLEALFTLEGARGSG